jgi:hypothetical protein
MGEKGQNNDAIYNLLNSLVQQGESSRILRPSRPPESRTIRRKIHFSMTFSLINGEVKSEKRSGDKAIRLKACSEGKLVISSRANDSKGCPGAFARLSLLARVCIKSALSRKTSPRI